MLRFLKGLLGEGKAAEPCHPRPTSQPQDAGMSVSLGGSAGGYFETLGMLEQAISKRDYKGAARLTRENIRQVPEFVRSTRREFGRFDIPSIPALQHGGTMLALLGDADGLREMREVVSSVPELRSWISAVDQHDEDMHLFAAILRAVAEKPGCLQTDVKALLGVVDGRRVANLISWLEKAGKISRTKEGSTYSLSVAGPAHGEELSPKRLVESHRADRNPGRCCEIDLKTLPYTPLPRAPLRWEEKGPRAPDRVQVASEAFEIRDAKGWELLSVEKIPLEARPDPAFRQIHPVDTGLIMVDDLGKSLHCGSAPAAALCYGRTGDVTAEATLPHDVYRVGVNALGSGLIAMSRDCIVHAYDSALHLVLETSLTGFPEIRALQSRFQIASDNLKNHLRCVGMAFDHSRYLFTGVDEAWCMDMEGHCLWGVRLPPQEGWSRVAEPSRTFGTSAEVKRALAVMDLALPFTPEDVKLRYRECTKRWHPDLNPGNPAAEERMTAVNLAAEILTGLDQTAVPHYAGATFQKDLKRAEFAVGGTTFRISTSMCVSELGAADWIYAANFGGRSHDVFLAGYSGRIVQVTGEGTPVRAYDIGAVPRRIVDTGDYLYFLTDTRHYTLRGDSLVALTDMPESGDLLVAQTGFGLLEGKRFRWFREDGLHLGTVVTRDPIRRVYYTPSGMVVETRERRAVIGGVGTWWE